MSNLTKYPKYRWFVMASFCLTTIVSAILMMAPSPMVGLISKTYGITVGASTLLMMGSMALTGLFAGMAGGFIMDKYGYAPSAIIANLLMLVGAILMPLAGNVPAAAILRAIQGLGVALLVGCSPAVAATWFPKEQRAILTGIQGTSLSLGVAIAFGLAPIILKVMGNWQSAIALLSIAPAIGLAVSIIGLFGPNPPQAVDEYALPSESKSDLALAFRQTPTYAGMFIAVCAFWMFQGFNDLTPGYYSVDPPVGLGYGIATGSQLMGIMQIAFLIGSFASGFILQKIFKGVSKNLLLLGFILTAVFVFSIRMPFVYSSKLATLVAMILIGFFMSLILPVYYAFVSLHYPAEISGKIGGLCTAVGMVGGTVGILVGASLLHYTGNYKMSIGAVSTVALVGLVFSFFLNHPRAFSRRSDGPIGTKSIGCNHR